MFSLNYRDLLNGLIVAILAPLFIAVTTVISAVVLGPGFDVFTVDWHALGHSLANSSIIASYGGFVGYMTKNFFTNNQGSFANITPETNSQ